MKITVIYFFVLLILLFQYGNSKLLVAVNLQFLSSSSARKSTSKLTTLNLLVQPTALTQDFAVDLETGETDYIVLRDSDSVLIPNDKAHGFLTLEPNTIVVYLVEGEYNPESEHSIVWTTNPVVKDVVNNFTDLHPLVISEKDALGK